MSAAPSRATTAVAAMISRACSVALTAALALALPGCRVDETSFQQRVFGCEKGATDPGCGTDGTGRAMSCFAASQIGGTDFCAATCDYDPAAPIQDGSVCLKTNADVGSGTPNVRLKTCKPSDDLTQPNGACGQKSLGCYRTDLVEDQGVCTTMSPCALDRDCPDPIRSVCATTFLANTVYPDATNIKQDHMFCLQTGCKALGTSCSPGETCLQNVIPPEANPPDICVPNCDSSLDCPPNFLCYRKVSTVVTPKVCIPGLLGFTCADDMDCMLGTCRDNGIGYKVCTTACQTESDCQQYDGVQGKFTCVKNNGIPTDPGNCQTPDSYRGSLCVKDDDCKGRNADEICNRFDPKSPTGTCLLPCSALGTCAMRGGINHTCLRSGVVGAPSVCFPGYFGYPCAENSNCIGDLICGASIMGFRACTKPCTSTADCQGAGGRWVGAGAWCSDTLQTCQGPIADGSPIACTDNLQCKSGKCDNGACVSTGATN